MRFLDFEIALRFGLLRQGKRFRQDSFLVGLSLGNRRFALGQSTFDGGITIGFGRGNVGVALDACDIGLAHIGDVFVLVADFLDGEGDDFKAHLVHVFRAG